MSVLSFSVYVSVSVCMCACVLGCWGVRGGVVCVCVCLAVRVGRGCEVCGFGRVGVCVGGWGG